MGYYMRFFQTDSDEITLGTLEAALKGIDPAYVIRDASSEPFPHGLLAHSEELLGEIEINAVESGEDEELEEFREAIDEEGGSDANRDRVLKVLDEAKAVVALRVLWQGRENEATLKMIDPLWSWLFANRHGLLQADGEGFYDHNGLLLEVG